MKVEYKLGVTMKLRPDDPQSYEFLRVDVGVVDVDPEGDIDAQMTLALEAIEQNVAPAVEAAVGTQMANSGNIAIEGVGIAGIMRDAWADLAGRVKKLEGKKQ